MEHKFLDVVINDVIWWIIISGFALTILFLTGKTFLKKNKTKEESERNSQTILYLGILAFLTGILAQTLCLISGLNAIIRAGDISFALVVDWLKNSFYLSVYGLIVFILSLIIGLIFKNIVKNKKAELN